MRPQETMAGKTVFQAGRLEAGSEAATSGMCGLSDGKWTAYRRSLASRWHRAIRCVGIALKREYLDFDFPPLGWRFQ